jgi:hypothetical protein
VSAVAPTPIMKPRRPVLVMIMTRSLLFWLFFGRREMC